MEKLPADVIRVMYDTPFAVRNAVKMLKPLCASGPEVDTAFAILETVAFRQHVVLVDHVDDLDKWIIQNDLAPESRSERL